MTTASPNSFVLSASGNAAKATAPAAATTFICGACPVTLSITVPAYTAYIIDYETYFRMDIHNAGMTISFRDTWSDAPITSYPLYAIGALSVAGTGWSGIHHWNNVDTNVGNYQGYGLVLYNDTSSPKQINKYSFLSMHADINSGTDMDFAFTDFTVTAKKIDAPTTTNTTTPTYDGTNKTFNFTFDSPAITDYNYNISYSTAFNNIETTVEAKDFEGNTIPASTYSWDTSNVNGTFTAKNAGTYKLKFNLTSDAIANGIIWKDGSNAEKQTVTFEIKRKPISVPTVQNSTQIYKAYEYDNFTLLNYDKDLMSVSSYTSNNGSSISWDDTAGAEKFKATDAAEYTVKFHMDSPNYIWNVDGNESASDQSKTITINKKEISINTTPAANSNPTFGLGDTGSITVNATASGITNPDFVLNVYYVKNTDTTNPLNTGISGTTLDVSQIESSGDYTLCIELTSAGANKNYCITNDKFEMPFTIGSGAINFKVINWQYKEGTGNATDLFTDDDQTVQEVLRYKKDDNGIVKYYITANIPAGGYLSIDTSYTSNGYTNGILTTNSDGATVQYADKVGKYKTRVALNTDNDHKFKAGDNYGSFGGDDTKGWYEIEWEIEKGKIDQDYLDNLDKNLQYKIAGGSWQTYDPDNAPNYGNGAVEIRLNPAKYPDGISGATITINDKNTNIGTYTAQVTFTTDTTNYEPLTTQSFQWKIAAKAIEVDWTSAFWTDGNGDNILDTYGAPYQIKELNISDDLKQYVEYHYYVANSDLTMGSFIGVGDVGLEALTSAPYNASSNNPVTVYVKAVIKSGVTQYEIKDNSGNDGALLFKLGDTKTLAKVTQSETEMFYGESKFNESIFTIIGDDTNAAIGSNFIEGIYVYDPQGNSLGLLSAFDCTTAAVGEYTVKIVLTEAGEDTYTLTPGSTFKFNVKPKAIAVPTLSEIVFKNDFINLEDYLGGSWNDYKDIIRLGGTYDGVKNAGTYNVTLTLIDSNYCWDYGTDLTPAKATVKYSLADGTVTWNGDETVASCDWNIAPYVLKASGWNLSGKEGAVYNIPAELTAGLDGAVQLWYYTDKASNPLGEGDGLKAGNTYFVKAELLGAYKDNFIFEDSKATTSDFATYKVPQNGAAAFLNNVKTFMLGTWLGLPIWAWFAIGLAVLILLIIIIAVCAKRRKTKEQREEIKARKEEEKQRREDERRMQQERLQAERELAMAKQQAELEKIRAQSGMATMAMPAQQAMPTQVQQTMPVQQPMQQFAAQPSGDVAAAIANIQSELAQIRANQNASHGYSVPSGGMADYHSIYAEERARAAEARLSEERIRAEERARAAEQRAMLAEERYLRGGMQGAGNAIPAEVVVALLQAVKNGNIPPVNITTVPAPAPVAELPQNVEESATVSTPAMYPADAVITTTTTVDTTKKSETPSLRRTERDSSNEFSDVDGFYDSIDY